jgi:hypothetical protein
MLKLQMEMQMKQKELDMKHQQKLMEVEAERESDRMKIEAEVAMKTAALVAETDLKRESMQAEKEVALQSAILGQQSREKVDTEVGIESAKNGPNSNDTLAMALQGFSAVLENINRPKRVVRGADGRVEGIE